MVFLDLTDFVSSKKLHPSVVHSHWSRIIEALLSLVEIMVLLHQLSYAIKNQLKACKFAGSLWLKDRLGGFHARKGPIRVGFHAEKGSILISPPNRFFLCMP